jgi:diamine N-acetyltransferase
MPEMVRVTDRTDIDSVAHLAHEIWNRHFVPIVGQEQVDYMLAKFQSAQAISEQIINGYQYHIVMDDGQMVGYFAIVPCPNESSAQLSKIYVKHDQRGRGLGKAIMAFVEECCVNMGIRRLWLTVNRRNTGPISFYRHMGFTKAESLIQDIGRGFVMDDYRMVKIIGQRENAT